jgi:CHAD domain-containing protein/8-oxo-dGTP pyrophosphatase MutT (NUDIX family)
MSLARHGITFRHRIEDGAGVWQLKLPRAGDARVELERAGPPAVPPPELVTLLPALLREEALVPVARLRTRREVVRARGAEIVDDSVAVLDHQRVTRRFREIEVELLDGDEQTLRQLEKALRQAGADGGAFTPKLYRALDLAYPGDSAEVTKSTATPEALARRLRAQAHALVSHDPGTRLGSDPEDLHQLRVATRRLRAYLRAARPLLLRGPARALRDELKWLGSSLGPVRDLDVLMEHFARELEELGAAGEGSGLVTALGARRDEARNALLESLASDRYFALLDALAGFVAEPPLSDENVPLADIWWREAKRLRRAAEGLAEDPADVELHEVRISVKRARYAAELAVHELGKRGARFIDRAKEAQDVLGTHQDAVVGEGEILAWAEGREEAASVAAELVAALGGCARSPPVTELVRAAGGVIVRETPAGCEVLLVYRPRYEDWTFPKGKAEGDECDEDCALREVEEETGLVCSLGRELPATEYTDPRGRPKRVRYWLMRVDSGELEFRHEVDAARWVDVDTATRLLSYPRDRRVLRAVTAE